MTDVELRAELENVWEFFKAEQKINQQLRSEIKRLHKRIELLGNLEKSVRDMGLENARLRGKVKLLQAAFTALGETK